MKADLHIHTNASPDSIISPKELVRRAAKVGLDAVAVTDHNTTKGWKGVLEEARGRIEVIKGEEVVVLRNGRKIGEVLGLFLEEEVPRSDVGEIIDRMKEQDGFIVIPHPFDRFRKHLHEDEIRELRDRIDAIEAFNSRVVLPQDNERAFELAKELRLPTTAGSDSHTPWEIGAARTVADCSSLEDFRKALKKGKARIEGSYTNLLLHLVTKAVSAGNKLFRR